MTPNTTKAPQLAQRLPNAKNYLDPGTELLVSTFSGAQGGGGLQRLDETRNYIDRHPSTGLTIHQGSLYRVLWNGTAGPAEIIQYDVQGLVQSISIQQVTSPHDILHTEKELLVVATDQNEIRSIDWKCKTSDIYWKAPGARDSWHLNSLTQANGHLYVSAFGQYSNTKGWDHAGRPASGIILALDTGQILKSGLSAPHHPTYLGSNEWLVCNSARGEVVLFNATSTSEKIRRLQGWTRGIAVSQQHIFVGLSRHRHAAQYKATSSIAILTKDDLQVVDYIEVSADEIYTLCIAPLALTVKLPH